MVETVLNRCFVVSLHDLAPHSEAVCGEILRQLKALGVERTTLLATPQWHGGDRIDRHPEFLEWLRERERDGHEICLHGFTHKAESIRGGAVAQTIGRIYTASEGEFYQISYDEAQRRVREGLELLRNAGLRVQGFVAPAWLLSEAGLKALVDEGLVYTNEVQHFSLLQPFKRVFAPTLVFSSRSGWRRWTSIRWVKLWERVNRNRPVIRLAIHPGDCQYSAIRETILHLAEHLRKNRDPFTYLELAQRIDSMYP